MQYQRGTLISGEFSLKQLIKFLLIGIQMTLKKNSFDCAYLVISSSSWGNPRDLFLLALMGQQLQKKTVLHLHGSNIDRYFKRSPLYLKTLNKLILSQVRSSIVLGETFQNIFDGYIPSKKIEIVKNCYDPSLLISEADLEIKFKTFDKINILFLSNLIKEKGYLLLLDAFLSLPLNIRDKANLHFAGEVKSEKEKTSFLKIIKDMKNIFYHGPVDGQKKRGLLWNAHIFCLPTYYKYEGQPITIIEAYAAGCMVLTTDNGGIRDVFTNGDNGFFIDINLENSDRNENIIQVKKMLENVIPNTSNYKDIACFNRGVAMHKYSETLYCKSIENILLKAADSESAE